MAAVRSGQDRFDLAAAEPARSAPSLARNDGDFAVAPPESAICHPTRRRARTRRARQGCPAIAVAGIAPAVGDRGEANGRIARTEHDARVVDSVRSTRATTSGMAPAIRGTARCRRPRSLGGEDRQRQSISEPGLREELLQLCGIGPAQSLSDHTAIGGSACGAASRG